jgi:hypothetical protein
MAEVEEIAIGTPRGTTGDLYQAGSIWQRVDPRADLQGLKGLQIFDRMSFDSQISGALEHIKGPIKAGEWRIESAEPGNAEEDEIAEKCRETLLPGSTGGYDAAVVQSWNERVDISLSALEMGFSMGELLWATREDGWKYVAKIEERLQTSVLKWNFDPHGRFESVTQDAIFPDGRMEQVDLKEDEILLHVFRRRGNNMFGRPLTTPCYLHWYLGSNLLKLDGIIKERFGGTPVASVMEGVLQAPKDEQIEDLKKVLRNFRIHAEQSMIAPYPFKVDLIFPTGANADLLKSVEYHDAQKAKALLFDLMQHGLSQTGARAVTEPKAEMAFIGVRAIAQMLEEDYTRQVIVRTVIANKGRRKKYPRLVAPDFEAMRKSEQMGALMKLYVDAGILTPDDLLEEHIRKVNKWPGRDPKSARQKMPLLPPGMDPNDPNATKDPNADPTKGGEDPEKKTPLRLVPPKGKTDPKTPKAPAEDRKAMSERRRKLLAEMPVLQAAYGLSRMPFPHEANCMFADMAEYLEREPRRIWTRAIAKLRAKQIEEIAKAAAAATDAQLTTQRLDKASRLGGKTWKNGAVPYSAEMVEALVKELDGVYHEGRIEVLKEYGRATAHRFSGVVEGAARLLAEEEGDEDEIFDTEPSAADRSWIRRTAEALIAGYTGLLVSTAAEEAVNYRNADLPKAEVERLVRTALLPPPVGSVSEANAVADLAGNVARTFTNARNDQADALGERVTSAYYSAIMDSGTCPACEALDGEQHEPGDPDFITPNPLCDGGLRCRCVTVYVFRGPDE